jgi:Ca2+-binding EF-hand superfamily protein
MAHRLSTPDDGGFTVKWDEYVEFQQNTKAYSKSMKRAKALSAAAKSGSIEQHVRDGQIRREKKARQKTLTKKARKKVRVKPKKYTVVAGGEFGSELDDPNTPTGEGSDGVPMLAGPPVSSLVIDPQPSIGRKGGSKEFVKGGHRAAKMELSNQKKRIRGPKHAATKQFTTGQALRQTAMAKRKKMWEDLKKRQLGKAEKKSKQKISFLAKQVRNFEMYIWRKEILFDNDNPDYIGVLTCINEIGFSQSSLRSFRVSFDNYDIDFSGEIDYVEFAMMCESMAQTKSNLMGAYLNAIFEIFDIDQSGTLEFHEFIQMCSCYCMYRYGDIIEFCFKTFDTDGSGFYTEDEFQDLAKALAADDPLFPGNFQTALATFDADGDGLISFKEFKEMCRAFPSIFHPAVRGRIIGATYCSC